MSWGRSTSFGLMDSICELIDKIEEDDNSKFQKELKATVCHAIKKNIFSDEDKLKLKNLCTPYDLDYDSDDEDLFNPTELGWIHDFSIRDKLKGLKLSDFGLEDTPELDLDECRLAMEYQHDYPETESTLSSLTVQNCSLFGAEQIDYLKLIVNRHKQQREKAVFKSAAFNNKKIILQDIFFEWSVIYINKLGQDLIFLKINITNEKSLYYDLQSRQWIEKPLQEGSTKKITSGLERRLPVKDESSEDAELLESERPKKTDYKVKWALFTVKWALFKEKYLSPITSPIASLFIWCGFKLGLCGPESTIDQFITEVPQTKLKKENSKTEIDLGSQTQSRSSLSQSKGSSTASSYDQEERSEINFHSQRYM